MLKYLGSPFAVVALLTASFLFANQTSAGPLTSAEVTKIINQVSVVDPAKGGRPATLREVIKNDLGLETGIKSRSELLFQDNTLTRIGAETFFSFKTGTRDLTLEKGSMLLQVPKGLGGAKIHTAAVTAAITGTTIMMEYIPSQYIKVLVLEGSLRLSRNGTFGDSLVLRPGKMVIMRPDAKKIPDPVDVDIEHIVKTSSLVNFPGAEPLPSMPLIQASIDDQQRQLTKKDLVPTNLVMGHGTTVVVVPTAPTVSSPSTVPGATGNGGSLAGGVVSTVGTTTTAATSTANNLLTSTTGTVGSVANNLLGAGSTLTTIPVATTVDNLLSSTTGTVDAVITNLAGTVSNVASIPVASSSQLISLLETAAPTVGGIATVTPTITSVTSAVTSTVSNIASSPTVSSVTTTAANTAGNITSTLLPTSTTSPTASSSTVPVLASPTSSSAAPISVINTVTSVPTTLLSGSSSTTSGLLGL